MLLLAVGAMLASREYMRKSRALELASELQRRGGQVYFPPSLIENLQLLWVDDTWSSETTVLLGDEIDGRWLRDHDYLVDIRIDRPNVYTDAQETEAIQRLIEQHPIKVIGVSWRQDADPIAESLATESELEIVSFSNSKLTDAGFRRLPLEQLEGLDVDGTLLTDQGLDALRRCGQLKAITLDGSQFTDSVAEILAGLPSVIWMKLDGPGVNDDVVPRLQKCQQLRFLYLHNSTITVEGNKALDASLPGCVIDINVGGTRSKF